MKKIILGATAACFLLGLLLFGTILYQTGYFRDDTSRAMIPLSDVPRVLNIAEMPHLPDWEVEKIQQYNDYFTSPTCTIYFTNGIELVLSKSQGSFDEAWIQYREGEIYYSFKPKKEQEYGVIQNFLKIHQLDDRT